MIIMVFAESQSLIALHRPWGNFSLLNQHTLPLQPSRKASPYHERHYTLPYYGSVVIMVPDQLQPTAFVDHRVDGQIVMN